MRHLLLLVSLGGCAGWSAAQPYHPVTVMTTATIADAFSAARLVAEGLGATRIDVDERRHLLRAYVPGSDGTRERIGIEVSDIGEVIVRWHSELFEDGEWTDADWVCDSYTWSRERFVANGILAMVSPDMVDTAKLVGSGAPFAHTLALRAQDEEDPSR